MRLSSKAIKTLPYLCFMTLAVFIEKQQWVSIPGHAAVSMDELIRYASVIAISLAACFVILKINSALLKSRLSDKEADSIKDSMNWFSVLFLSPLLIGLFSEIPEKTYLVLFALWYLVPFLIRYKTLFKFFTSRPFADKEQNARFYPETERLTVHMDRTVLKHAFSPAVILILLVSISISMFIAYTTGVSNTDFSSYIDWGRTALKWGPGELYSRTNCTYTPVFVYFLWVSAALEKTFGIHSSQAIGLVYKMFPLLSLHVMYCLSALISILCRPGLNRPYFIRLALIITLNPAFIYLAAAWGQTDTMLVCFFLLTLLGIITNNLFFLLTASAVGVLFKPPMVFMLPLMIPYVFFSFSLRKTVISAGLATLLAVLLVLPFIYQMEPLWLVEYFLTRSSKFTFTSLNAGTLMGLLGGSHLRDSAHVIMGISYLQLSQILLAIMFCTLFFTYKQLIRDNTKEDYVLLAVCSVYAAYYLSARMHSRFLLYGLALFIVHISLFQKNRLLKFISGWGLSIVCFIQMITHFPVNLSDTFVSYEVLTYLPVSDITLHYLLCFYQLMIFIMLCTMLYRSAAGSGTGGSR